MSHPRAQLLQRAALHLSMYGTSGSTQALLPAVALSCSHNSTLSRSCAGGCREMVTCLRLNTTFPIAAFSTENQYHVRRLSTSSAAMSRPAVSHIDSVSNSGSDSENGKAPTPSMIVKRLDNYIVGQASAKRSVAIALRNRWRRHRVMPESMRDEINPKNILMIGPTGCGKTEIARRLAKLADAPFVKCEATKFTEIGFHGRDVDQIIRDLVENSITLTKQQFRMSKANTVKLLVEERILTMIIGDLSGLKGRLDKRAKGHDERHKDQTSKESESVANISDDDQAESDNGEVEEDIVNELEKESDKSREHFRLLYRRGELDDLLVEVDLSILQSSTNGNSGGSGSQGGGGNFQLVVDTPQSSDRSKQIAIDAIKDLKIIFENIRQEGDMSRPSHSSAANLSSRHSGMSNIGGVEGLLNNKADGSTNGNGTSTGSRRMRVRELRPILEEDETNKLQSDDKIVSEALRRAESDGIVFIDEIDKICRSKDHSRHSGADASSEGVQRDLLPIIEGSAVSTKYGTVNTDHILFICCGAFHAVKPSDMLAELQGRLPIRVELKPLSAEDMYQVLTTPSYSMVKQQQALMKTEGVDLHFTERSLRYISEVAVEVNNSIENIGARRLHTIMEKIVEDISFSAPDFKMDKDHNETIYASDSGKDLKADDVEVVIDREDVEKAVSDLMQKRDLMKYVL